jgi:hypothetical protein
VYTPTQNNVIDIEKYTYLAQVIEESGINAWSLANDGNRYVSVVSSVSGIPILANRH